MFNKYKYLLLIIAVLILIIGCLYKLETNKNQEASTNTAPEETNNVGQKPPLRIIWQGRSYIATKGIYIGGDVEAKGKSDNGFDLYIRTQQPDLSSVLVKRGEEQYLIYKTEEQ